MAGKSFVFLSHAAADAALAEYIESVIRESASEIEVFRTTRVGQVPSGLSLFQHIGDHLRGASRYMVLLTPVSQSRPWVCFEAGAAWMTGKKLVPVLGGGLSSSEVVEPLRNLQLLSLENAQQAAQAFQELGFTLADPKLFSDQCRLHGETSKRAARRDSGRAPINSPKC